MRMCPFAFVCVVGWVAGMTAPCFAQTPLLSPDPARGHVENAIQTLSIQDRMEAARAQADKRQTKEGQNELSAPHLSVAVSLALQKDYLERLAAAARRIGARLVVQGVDAKPETVRVWAMSQSQKDAHRAELRSAWSRLAEATHPAGVELDPAFFTRYGIQSVPVTVLEWEGNAALVRGAVDLNVAVETLAQRLLDTARSCGKPQSREAAKPQSPKAGNPQNNKAGESQDHKTTTVPRPCSAQSQEDLLRAVAWLQRQTEKLTGLTDGSAP